VRDFAPYIAKIKASGADTVVTGNWGSDLSLLVKAANEGGYTGKFFTYYAGVTGTPDRAGHQTALAAFTRSPTATTTWVARWTSRMNELQGQVQRRLLHRLHDPHL
jgi:ABC-type branched-subunit amino acid transport system substrate-binding protein